MHYKTSKTRLYVNYHYVIESIDDKNVTIIEPVDNINITLTIDKLKKHFKLPYANTCDSVQGLRLGEKITIFDCNTPYVDRYYIWTALTRAKDMKNVQVFEHSDQEVMSLKKSWLNYISLKRLMDTNNRIKKQVDNTIIKTISTLNGLKFSIEIINTVHYVKRYSKLQCKRTTK